MSRVELGAQVRLRKLHTTNENSAFELGVLRTVKIRVAPSVSPHVIACFEYGWHVVLIKHFYPVSHVVMFRVAIGRPTKLDQLVFHALHSQLLF